MWTNPQLCGFAPLLFWRSVAKGTEYVKPPHWLKDYPKKQFGTLIGANSTFIRRLPVTSCQSYGSGKSAKLPTQPRVLQSGTICVSLPCPISRRESSGGYGMAGGMVLHFWGFECSKKLVKFGKDRSFCGNFGIFL